MAVQRLDCLGDMCPIPLMKLMKLKPQLDRGESVLVVTDHSCTRESLMSYCGAHRYPVQVAEPVNGVWELRIGPQDA